MRFLPSTLHIACDAAVMFMLYGGWGWGGMMTSMLHEGYGDVEVT